MAPGVDPFALGMSPNVSSYGYDGEMMKPKKNRLRSEDLRLNYPQIHTATKMDVITMTQLDGARLDCSGLAPTI